VCALRRGTRATRCAGASEFACARWNTRCSRAGMMAHHTFSGVRRIPPRFRLVILAFSLVACEQGETGDSCWSDWDCRSGSCSFGTCDSEWFSLVRILIDVASSSDQSAPPAEEAPRPGARAVPEPSTCSSLSARECERTPGCTSSSLCTPGSSCGSLPDGGGSCSDCFTLPPCPAQCDELTYCY
jgi:hypothetical protein